MSYTNWLKKYNLLTFSEVDSTNLEAVRLIKAGIYGDFVIWAETQTMGKGRGYQRKWISEPGNLYLSIIKRHHVNLNSLPQICFVAAVAVEEVVSGLIRRSESLDEKCLVHLKWPNDILINHKKAGGILVESMAINEINYSIIGIGLNILHAPTDLPYAATSIQEENIQELNTADILHKIIISFDKYMDIWQKSGFIEIRRQWLKKAYKLNQVITVDDGNSRISGIFKEIDFNGALRLQMASGQFCSLIAGEVINH